MATIMIFHPAKATDNSPHPSRSGYHFPHMQTIQLWYKVSPADFGKFHSLCLEDVKKQEFKKSRRAAGAPGAKDLVLLNYQLLYNTFAI